MMLSPNHPKSDHMSMKEWLINIFASKIAFLGYAGIYTSKPGPGHCWKRVNEAWCGSLSLFLLDF